MELGNSYLIVTRERKPRELPDKDVILAWTRFRLEESAASQAAPSRYALRALPDTISSHLPEQRLDVGATGGRSVDNTSGRGLFMSHLVRRFPSPDRRSRCSRVDGGPL